MTTVYQLKTPTTVNVVGCGNNREAGKRAASRRWETESTTEGEMKGQAHLLLCLVLLPYVIGQFPNAPQVMLEFYKETGGQLIVWEWDEADIHL